MSKSNSKIVEALGKFIVELADGVVMFDTEAEAATALVEFEKGAEHRALAAGFCAFQGIEADSKNAKGKANVITAYLVWVEAGQPERVVEEAADETPADDAPAGDPEF